MMPETRKRFARLVASVIDVIDAKIEARQKRLSLRKLMIENADEIEKMAQQGYDDPASLSHDEIRALGAIGLAKRRD